MKRFRTIREAAESFVSEFNAIYQGMIAKLMQMDPDDWQEVTVFSEDEPPHDFLPMWGTMWSFHDWVDRYWIEEMDGVEVMSELGFRIYFNEDFGYFFGIDGAGYDFYEAHWIPLYRIRGLQWHDEEVS